MKALHALEEWLVGISKNLPKLSDENKRLTTQALPWVAVVFGILQLLSALGLWDWLQEARRWGWFSFVGYRISEFDIVMAYASMALLVAMAVLLLIAYAPLRARARRGWELLLITGIVNVGAGLVALFVAGRGVASFLFSLLVSAIIFYLLVQVRGLYKAKSGNASRKNSQ